jgi:hypothetical protein
MSAKNMTPANNQVGVHHQRWQHIHSRQQPAFNATAVAARTQGVSKKILTATTVQYAALKRTSRPCTPAMHSIWILHAMTAMTVSNNVTPPNNEVEVHHQRWQHIHSRQQPAYNATAVAATNNLRQHQPDPNTQ